MFNKPQIFYVEPQANQNLGRKKLEVAFQVWQSGLFDFFILYKSRLLTEKVSHQTYAARRRADSRPKLKAQHMAGPGISRLF